MSGFNQRFISALRELAYCYNIIGDERRYKYYNTIFVDLAKTFREELNTNNMTRLVAALGKDATPAFKRSVKEFVEYKTLPKIAELKQRPEYIAYNEFKDVLGVGPETIRLWSKLGITTRAELNRRIANDGFKISDLQKIGLTYVDRLLTKIPRAVVSQTADNIYRNAVKHHRHDVSMDICGSYRRGKSYSGDIDLVMCNHSWIEGVDKTGLLDFNGLVQNIMGDPRFLAKIGLGKEKFSFYYQALWNDVKSVIRVDVEWCLLEDISTTIMYFTGSREFNIRMRGIAKAAGMKLNQHGLYKGKRKLITHFEEDIFKKLKLQYVRPEHRE